MSCFNPRQALISRKPAKNGGIRYTFGLKDALADGALGMPTQMLPCGVCIGCRLNRARQWAIRGYHESMFFKSNLFVTLTYRDDNNISLNYSDFQSFLKRLRKKFGNGIKFLMCGEYGDKFGRPHFHAIFFGLSLDDMVRYRKTDCGHVLYKSEMLNKIWRHGYCIIGHVTYDSISYVARYITKKVYGKSADDYYTIYDLDTREPIKLVPEFSRCSLKEGIGSRFFNEYKNDIYPNDFVVINGAKVQPPRYYDKLLERTDPDLYAKVKLSRRQKATLKYSEDDAAARLRDKEYIQMQKFKKLIRSFDNDT